MSVWSAGLGLLVCLCCLSLGLVQGGKVLVLPVDASPWLSMKILVKELNSRGHEVLVLVPERTLLMNSKESFKTEVYKVHFSQADLDDRFKELREGLFDKPPEITDMFVNMELLVNYTSMQCEGCESLLKNEPLMRRLRETGFDVVLSDPFLPCGPVLAHLLSIPAVYFLRGLPCDLDSKANMNPSPPSYIPVAFSGNSNHMTFTQRVKNVVMSYMEEHMCKVIYVNFDELVSKYVKDQMTYKELISHAAVWLYRYDFTFEWPKPIMPNAVFIGGINCAEKAPLPADLKEFVDGSGDDGFIVFTLGSMVSNMPEKTAKQFFDAFRQIPQRVLWRYTGVVPEDVPKNVKLLKWLPQKDLLAHPKAKVFITHGGIHGIYESICNGVPMLIFPLFGDQIDNVHRMVVRGVAEKLQIYDITSEKLLAALNNIIHNKSYKEKMVELSELHLDRPVQPLDLAVFWTEFVIRHKGAAHLRVTAHELNWIQYHCLDVLGLFILILITVLWLTLRCCSFCFRKLCRKESTKRKKE